MHDRQSVRHRFIQMIFASFAAASLLASSDTTTLASFIPSPGEPDMPKIGIDGTLFGDEFPPALAQQSTGTGFGNNVSELDALYAFRSELGLLHVFVSGNVEGNGNSIVLFLDVKPGGCVESTLRRGHGVIGSIDGQRCDDWGTDVDGDVGVWPTPAGGSVLSPGFDPDYALEVSLSGIDYHVNVIDLSLPNEPHPDRDIYLGSRPLWEFSGENLVAAYPPNGAFFEMALNNTNVNGVNALGDETLGDPLSANTGLELAIGPEMIAPGAAVKIMAFITNGGGDYLSNQFLPGLPEGTPNLGPANELGEGDPLFDARDYPGPMFVTIDPLPCAADIIDDGLVNTDDLILLIGSWGRCPVPPTLCPGDITGNGVVNTDDLLFVIGSWGECP